MIMMAMVQVMVMMAMAILGTVTSKTTRLRPTGLDYNLEFRPAMNSTPFHKQVTLNTTNSDNEAV